MIEHPSFETVLRERILIDGETSYTDVCKRVSNFIFQKPSELEDREKLYNYMMDRVIIPASPYLMQAGTARPQICSCFVIDVEDTLESIYQAIAHSAKIFQYSGGVGINWSNLRPEGSPLSNGGTSSGVLPFLKEYNQMVEAVKSGGRKKGAAIAILDIDHGDIEKFITMKNTEGELNNINISVRITDEFLHKINHGDLESIRVMKLIAQSIWTRAEPGILFADTINKGNRIALWKSIRACNPCLHESSYMITQNGLEQISSKDVHVIWNGNEYSKCNCWSNGIKSVIRVSTKSGFEWVVTPDHKFMLDDGSWCEAQDLIDKRIKFEIQEHDWVGINSYPDCNYELLGFEFGDGNYHKASGRMKYIYATPKKDIEVINLIENEFNDKFYLDNNTKLMINIPYGSVYASAFTGILPERMIPDWIMTLPKEQMKLFLRGLFSANGTNLKKYHKIQLVSSNKDMLKQIQQMLLLFGIKGKLWWHNEECTQTFYNGDYVCKQSWHIVISRLSYVKFLNDIGFIQEYKCGYADDGHVYTDEIKYETICDISDAGLADVWDFNEPVNHYGVCSGAYVHNCGELIMPPYGSCNLIGIDVSKITSYDMLDDVMRLCVRTGDNAIDLCMYPLSDIEYTSKYIRQLGIYPMGVADFLIKNGLSYDSVEGRDAIFDMWEYALEVGRDESINLGISKGVAPVIKDGYWSESWSPRNTTINSAAPSGTTSLIANCSSGIEPVFSFVAKRTSGCGSGKYIVHPLFEDYVRRTHSSHYDAIMDYMYTNGSIQSYPIADPYMKSIFKTALDISPKDHVQMQSKLQTITDTSLSKTVNCPESITPEEILDTIMYAWETGCKGLTFYRQNSRKEVVYDLKKEEPQLIKVVEVSNPVKYKLLTKPEGRILPKTPREVPGALYKRNSGCGKLMIAIGEVDGRPHSITIVNKGGCDALTQAVTELTSLCERYEIPQWNINKVLMNIKCSAAMKNPKSDGKSCPDIIGKILDEYYPHDEEPPKETPNYPELPSQKKKTIQSVIACPECGEGLIHESGCVSCSSCSYTRCN